MNETPFEKKQRGHYEGIERQLKAGEYVDPSEKLKLLRWQEGQKQKDAPPKVTSYGETNKELNDRRRAELWATRETDPEAFNKLSATTRLGLAREFQDA